MDHVIEIKNLTKSFKDVRAVDGISFRVRPGEFFAFLGVNAPQKNFPRIVDILARAFGKNFFPAFFVLPSRFPNGRFAPRTKNSCAYSNGYCSGLSPDFLIPAPAKTCSHNAGTQCRLLS